jgi:hypothetical protein
MKPVHMAYGQFVGWVQTDMKKDRVLVNRKVFSVVLWCLVLPTVISMILYALRKYQFIEQVRYADTIMFLPPFAYALYSIWPTLRDLPRVFRKGGLGAMMEESLKEVEWREKVATQLQHDLKLTTREWAAVSFHLKQDIDRMNDQNRYMTILTAVVLFFMFQFLDLGGSADVVYQTGPTGLVKAWVDQFSQWSIQVISLLLFSALFYLSGLQFQRYLSRYWVCVQRIVLDELNPIEPN